MSYILDSLKKSEKERQSVSNTASMTMRSPAFLENDKPSLLNQLLWPVIIIITLIIIGYLLFFSQIEVGKGPFNSPVSQVIVQAKQVKMEQPEIVVAQEQKKDRVVTSLISRQPSQAKEEAILLYEKALQEKNKPEVDFLYRKIDEEQAEIAEQALAVLSNDRTPLPTVAVESPPEKVEPEVFIPSIYQLDPLVKRNIPSLDYGAHIYATDNKSGFIILNGARRRAGDKLDNGIYIEKIAEEDAILSYNGVVFSLPAMKSWTGS
ncbi:MAG: general secretion pathway protein GspB [Cellvibrionaceae bacterium]